MCELIVCAWSIIISDMVTDWRPSLWSKKTNMFAKFREADALPRVPSRGTSLNRPSMTTGDAYRIPCQPWNGREVRRSVVRQLSGSQWGCSFLPLKRRYKTPSTLRCSCLSYLSAVDHSGVLLRPCRTNFAALAQVYSAWRRRGAWVPR